MHPKRSDDDPMARRRPSRTWLIGLVVSGRGVLVLLGVLPQDQPPRPLASQRSPGTPVLSPAPQEDMGLFSVAATAPPVVRITLTHDTTASWSASAADGPPVQAGTVLSLEARTADGQRMLAPSPVWAQPLWVASQDTTVMAATLCALPVLTDPPATPLSNTPLVEAGGGR